KGVLSSIDEVIYLGDPISRLPGSACFSIKFIEGESLILNLERPRRQSSRAVGSPAGVPPIPRR
ncbi:MAG: hypothetical protein ABGZ35_14080, partial [Planctomycetaceae bacterium]